MIYYLKIKFASHSKECYRYFSLTKPKKGGDEFESDSYYYSRENKPSVEGSDGYVVKYLNNVYHCTDGPAIITKDSVSYYINGKLHREDGPAIINKYDGSSFYKNGELYKIIDTEGNQFYYKKNRFHRKNGPAVIYVDGTKKWYKKGKLHREDGPAVEHSDGNDLYFLEDHHYSKEEYYKIIKEDEI